MNLVIAENKAKDIEDNQKKLIIILTKPLKEDSQPEINDLQKQYYDTDNEDSQEQLEAKHMMIQIEKNKLAPELHQK